MGELSGREFVLNYSRCISSTLLMVRGSDISVKSVTNSMTEDVAIEKIAELMETIDSVKKYEILDRYFKKFTLIVVASLVIMVIANTVLLSYSGLVTEFSRTQRFFLTYSLLITIPITGTVIGILFVRAKINAIKTGLWKDELSKGFPSALKLLSEIKWESSITAGSSGGIGYVMYGLVKGVAYWFIIYFALNLLLNTFTYLIFHQTGVLGGSAYWFTILIVFVYLKRDLSRRIKEIRAIDKLHGELRRFSHELRNAEF